MKALAIVWVLIQGPTAAELDAITESGGNVGTNYFSFHDEFTTEAACKRAERKLARKLRGQYGVACVKEERP